MSRMNRYVTIFVVFLFQIWSTTAISQKMVIGGGVGYATFNSDITRKVLRSNGYSGYLEVNHRKLSWGINYYGSRSKDHLINQYSLLFGKLFRRNKRLQFPLYSHGGYYKYTDINQAGLPVDFGNIGFGGIVGVRYRFGVLNLDLMANFANLKISKIGNTRSTDGLAIRMEHISLGVSFDINVEYSSSY